MCPKGTNVGLDLVPVEPLNWITDNMRANN